MDSDLNNENDKIINDSVDGRKRYEWKTGYPPEAQKAILCETCILFIFLIVDILLLFLTWQGYICRFFSFLSTECTNFKKFAYYALSGMLGCIIFGMKYFYRVVARGYWHQDRRIWRIMSPFIAMIISFIIGIIIDAGYINSKQTLSTSVIITIGFISGYFADEAVGKMYEIAMVIFGTSSSKKNIVEKKYNEKSQQSK